MNMENPAWNIREVVEERDKREGTEDKRRPFTY